MYGNKAKKSVGRTFKLFNCKTSKIMASFKVTDEEILGRFKSGLYTLVDGHFYFGNSVIKVRYDVLEKDLTTTVTEANLFDKYSNLLDLHSSETVQTKNPLLCIDSRRVLYLTRNFKKLQPKRLIMLPFLHERKVFLQKNSPDCEYFYTVLDDEVGCNDKMFNGLENESNCSQYNSLNVAMNLTKNKYAVYSETGILL